MEILQTTDDCIDVLQILCDIEQIKVLEIYIFHLFPVSVTNIIHLQPALK